MKAAGELRRPAEACVDGVPVRRGSVLPLPPRKLVIRPTAPIDNRPTFQPARGPGK